MRIFIVIGLLCMLAPGAHSQTSGIKAIRILRSGSQPSRRGPAKTSPARAGRSSFSGNRASARIQRPRHLQPGARTAWHHPLGQILIVTAEPGRVQRWGDP
jgi:hypothetical protein